MTESAQTPAVEHDEAIYRGQIVVLNRDLFFGVRLGNAMREAGYRVEFAKETAAFVERVRAQEPAAVLGIVDLNAGVDWEQIATLTADPAVATPILVFGPHMDVTGFRSAKAAGVRRIVSNGEFHRDMVGLVARYALQTQNHE